MTAAPLSYSNLLFYTTYDPPVEDEDLCTETLGESFLHVVDLVTGTASYSAGFTGALGLDNNDTLIQTTGLGKGYANQSYLLVGLDRQSNETQIHTKTPLDTAEIANTPVKLPPKSTGPVWGNDGRTSWRELKIQ